MAKSRLTGTGSAIKGVLSTILDLLFPPLCVECGEILPEGGGFACDFCCMEIEGIDEPYCSICGIPLLGVEDDNHICNDCIVRMPSFDVARSAFVYGGIVLGAIKRFKYNGRAHLAGPLTALALKEGACFRDKDVPGIIDPADFDILVPVPLYKKRLYERGFNQSLEIVRVMKRMWGDGNLSINHGDLIRTRSTVPQTTLTMEERRINVKGAFAVKGRAFSKKRLLLVDDVLTTGATVSECAKVLKDAGAEKVGVFTLTRSVIK